MIETHPTNSKEPSLVHSLDDPLRKELLWTERQEDLFDTWRSLCIKRTQGHQQQAKYNKWKYRILGTTMIVVPAVLSGVTQIYSPDWLVAFGFTASSLMSGIQNLFNYGGLYVQHNEFAAKYEDFQREIDAELIKPKPYRTACDVYLKSCEMTLNSLTRQAPDL